MQYSFSWLVLACYLPIIAQSQTVQDDFEGNGTITTWYGDDCGLNINLANPFQQGINNSATVLGYTDSGGPFSNVRFDIANNFNLSSHYLFSLKIFVPSVGLTGSQPNQISLKLQDGTLPAPWSTQSEIIQPLVLDEWQTVTFDFKNDTYLNLDPNSVPPTQRTDFNRVVLQINRENNTDKVQAFLDDFYFNGTVMIDPVYDYLVWSDEFDEDGAVNGTNWFHQTQLPIPGSWYNGEQQHYTDRTDNSFVENGRLKIVAKKESFSDQGFTKQYTSARLNSKFTFTYGKVEIRAKLPTGVGTWPALWMLGKNIDENGAYWDNLGYGTTPWPACGEIDIMEHWGHNQNYVQSAIHTPSSFGGTVNLGGQWVETASTGFHVYAMVWTPDKLVFSVDGVVHYTYQPMVKNAATWPFDKDQYLLLNIAIQSSISPDFNESAMEIDYVRVYQESPLAVTPTTDDPAPVFYPNPVDHSLHIDLGQVTVPSIPVAIYNLEGKLIKAYRMPVSNGELHLDNLGFLPTGMYIVNYELNQRHYSFRIIKH